SSSCITYFITYYCSVIFTREKRKEGRRETMIYWQIFKANFIANFLGYGGGPATIPLLEYEVVHKYGWFTVGEYSEMVALGNGLPGPIATKLAGYIGFEMGGYFGAFVGVFATVAPSMIMMLALLGFLLKHKESPK